MDGSYKPGEIRRVWIPKSGGGQRGLGIPNVVDRMVQESVRQVLEPVYEPTFHASSHGFRPGRSCHTAIAEAVKHVEEGHEWVVDLDLDSYFDRVNHQRLMSRLARRVSDKRLLVLIGRMLKAKVVMPDGVLVSTDEGVPRAPPCSLQEPPVNTVSLARNFYLAERLGGVFYDRFSDNVENQDVAGVFTRSAGQEHEHAS